MAGPIIDTQAPSKNTPNASGLEGLSVIALDFANSGFLSHLRVTGQFTTLSIADRLRGNQRTVDVAVLALQRLLRCLGLHLVLLRVNPKVPPPA